MHSAVESGLADAQEKVKASFDAVLDSWSRMSQAKQVELQEGFAKHSDRAAEQYRDRLENISNSWMVATVTTLDHQSRDVIAKIAATAEERLREASAEVFARFGDTLRERLQQIATSFDKPMPPSKP
jgi:DNA anti-recombination protein RmuC